MRASSGGSRGLSLAALVSLACVVVVMLLVYALAQHDNAAAMRSLRYATALECGNVALPRGGGGGSHRDHDHGEGRESGAVPAGGGALRAAGLRHHGDRDEAEAPSAPADASDAAPPASPGDLGLPMVLVLTPVKNAASHLGRYFRNLAQLDYPPSRLAVALLDSDSDDVPTAAQLDALRAAAAASRQVAAFLDAAGLPPPLLLLNATAAGDGAPHLGAAGGGGGGVRLSATLAVALAAVPALARRYARVAVLQHNFGLSLAREARHGQAAQRARRAVMARSRNHLLASALREGDEWALWVDADLHGYPPGVLRSLLGARAQVVVPNCVMEPGGRSYDLNSWRLGGTRAPGNNASVEDVRAAHDRLHAALLAGGQPPDLLQLEGYGHTGHVYLHHLAKAAEPRRGGGAVRLDAVGGAMLLVDAELHRQGLVFPPYAHRHRIETEGLSMLALDMGVLSWGLPDVEVLHR
jgi:hypothetical protein